MSKLKAYKKYQPVEYDYISQLPEDWQLLPNIAIFQERKETGGENLDSLSVSAIKGIVRMSDSEGVKDRTSEDKSSYLIVHKEDIPYNTMLMWAGAVGKSDFHGIVSPAYTVLKAKHKVELNAKYYHYMFRSRFYRDYAKRYSYGIIDSRLRLYYTYFKRMYSIFPPLETQNAIVSYLDRKTQQIQEFIAKKERLIELLEEQKRSVINKAITQGIEDDTVLFDTKIQWLGKVPNHWSVKKLKYITTLIADGTHVTPNYTNEGFPFLRITDIDGDSVNWSKVRYVSQEEHSLLTKTRKGKKGDVLLSKNGTIGKVIEVTWDEEFSFFVSLCLLRFKKSILPKYFSYFFKSDIVFDQLNEGSKSTSVTNLHLEKIKELIIAYPIIEQQSNICEYLDKECGVIEKVISKAHVEIEKAKEYQESLITQIITGQLKVPEKGKSNSNQNTDLGMVAEPKAEYHTNN